MQALNLLYIAMIMASHLTAADQNCPKLYFRYSVNHSYCLEPNEKCLIVTSTIMEKDIDVIVKRHNFYRSKIAVGKTVILTTASNMLQMVWDTELADLAQKWANQCEFETDCSDCRRVWNFKVEQRIFAEYVNISSNATQANWRRVIKQFYQDDIKYFARKGFEKFLHPKSDMSLIPGKYRKAFWAATWRLGCGFTLYKEENRYVKLYVCNYGPAGRDNPGPMYLRGRPCSACPENACCNQTCSFATTYQGLCVITDNEAPIYKREETNFWYCNFQNQLDCPMTTPAGSKKWLTFKTLSGNFIGLILKGGESSSITFQNTLKPQKKPFCFVINFRTGPTIDGLDRWTSDNNTAMVTFNIIGHNRDKTAVLQKFPFSQRNDFKKVSIILFWKLETEVTFGFAVPPDDPEQFFEIKEIYAYAGICDN